MSGLVLGLLVAFQVKHFLADYPLQGRWMLGKFKERGWVAPLFCHAGVHALMTALIANYVVVHIVPGDQGLLAVWVGLLDWFVHFVVDRVKASPRMLGRWKPDQRQFWWALGGDQMAHHLTHYAIIWLLVSR